MLDSIIPILLIVIVPFLEIYYKNVFFKVLRKHFFK